MADRPKAVTPQCVRPPTGTDPDAAPADPRCGTPSRYPHNLIATLVTAAAVGWVAGHFLPDPLAVMAIIGSLVAIAAAPFITPIDHPEEDA